MFFLSFFTQRDKLLDIYEHFCSLIVSFLKKMHSQSHAGLFQLSTLKVLGEFPTEFFKNSAIFQTSSFFL